MAKESDIITNGRIRGFPPFFGGGSKLLVLGSFPSVKSRAEGFFYGNRHNRFWGILGEFFGEKAGTIEEKKALLLRHKIAVWDIVAECEITGSLDGNIKNFVVADLNEVLRNADIAKIFVNGSKAYQIFKRNYPGLVDSAAALPSTSPANTRLDKKVWLDELEKMREILE